MEVTLIVVTLLSIALAIAMGILTWRLLQEERLRSDARVAALEQGLAETLQDAYVTQAAKSPGLRATTATADADPLASRAPSSAETAPTDLFGRDDTDWLSHFSASTAKQPIARSRIAERPIEVRALAPNDVGAASIANADDDTLFADDRLRAPVTADSASTAVAADDVPTDTMVNANGGLFGQIEADDDHVGWPRHVLAVAAVAAVMIGAVIAFWTIGRLMEPASDRAGTALAHAGTNAGAAANGAVTTALELMSLNQEMQDGKLTISGLVRNPRGGVPQERLTAVVFFFDGQGGFLSSTRAPLDYRALAPGEESPFQLSAPAPAGVARYRVSFRRDEGAVVPHVDRRQQVQQSLHSEPDQRSDAGRGHGQAHLQQEASRS
jgi:hypothetical protein